MKTFFMLLIGFVIFINTNQAQMNVEFKGKEINFKASDGVQITGDLYLIEDKDAPFIILYHQANYSRGEYRPIAPSLNDLGFNCLAIDQRAGKEINGVINQTNQEAIKQGKGTGYAESIVDLEAALDYVKNKLFAKKIIIWGSSYSAAHSFYIGSKYSGQIHGILAFSPGECCHVDDKKVKDHASNVDCPVFITSAKKEHDGWKDIYDSLKSEKYCYLPSGDGIHGSKALWPINEGFEGYWAQVKEFLNKLKN